VGRRSRKRQPAGVAPAAAAPDRPARPPRRSAQERDAAARAKLEPLAPGERPFWVTVAAALAFALAVGTLILVALDYQVTTGGSTRTSGLLQAAVLLVAAFGLWRARYWAVLGFEVLLGVTVVWGFLSLLVASNVWGALLALIVLAASGFLFYKLIRAMARIQMPRRPEPGRPR
jgi:hypothetical protein